MSMKELKLALGLFVLAFVALEVLPINTFSFWLMLNQTFGLKVPDLLIQLCLAAMFALGTTAVISYFWKPEKHSETSNE